MFILKVGNRFEMNKQKQETIKHIIKRKIYKSREFGFHCNPIIHLLSDVKLKIDT